MGEQPHRNPEEDRQHPQRVGRKRAHERHRDREKEDARDGERHHPALDLGGPPALLAHEAAPERVPPHQPVGQSGEPEQPAEHGERLGHFAVVVLEVGREGNERDQRQEGQVQDHHRAVESPQDLEQPVVDHPVPAHQREAERVGPEARGELAQLVRDLGVAHVRHLDVQHQQRDRHRHHAVAERVDAAELGALHRTGANRRPRMDPPDHPIRGMRARAPGGGIGRMTATRGLARRGLVAVIFLAAAAAPATAAASVDYGPISHSGLKKVGATSTGLKLGLQVGLIANNSGIQKAAKSAANPSSSSYGKYLSLSSLQSKYGATSSVRNGVVNAFKSQSVSATVDVTHLRVSATISVGKAQKMFGTKWADYKMSSGEIVALPVNTPKLPKGMKGNVDTVAGMRLTVKQQASSVPRPARGPVARASASPSYDGGTPTRTGSVGPN